MPDRAEGLLVVCPLVAEAASVRIGLRGGHVVRAGMRARRLAAVRSAARRFPGAPVAVVGVARALNGAARPGELVVPDVVRSPRGTHRCAAGPLLAALRQAGRTVHRGDIVESDRVVWRAGDAVADGAAALDLESALLLDELADGRPAVVLRAVVDTPARPLASLATVPGGIAALTALAASGGALRAWAAEAGRSRRTNDSVTKEVRHP